MRRFISEWGPGIAFFLALMLSLVPIGVRMSSDAPAAAGPDSYFNLRMAHLIQDNPKLDYDQLQEREYGFDIYHYFLAGILYFVSNDQTLLLSSLLLSFAAAFLLYQALMGLGLPRVQSLTAIIVYLFSPLYTYIAASLTSYALTSFFLALALFFYAKRPNEISLIPASLVALTDPPAFIVFFLSLAVFCYFTGREYRPIGVALLLGVGIGAIGVAFGYIIALNPVGGLSMKHYVTDLGASAGYSFFTMLLAAITLALFWGKDLKFRVTGMALVILFAVSTISPGTRIVMNILLSIYAAIAIDYFISRKWVVPSLQDLTLLLIISGLLFSSVSFVSRTATMEPVPETVASFQAIGTSRLHGVVLTQPEYGYLAEYFAGRPAHLDGSSYLYPDYEERLADVQAIANAETSMDAKNLLDKHKISYLYFDPVTLKSLQRRKSLLLIVETSDNFINVVRFQGRESWLYIRSE